MMEREEEENIDLNIFVVTFKYMKDGEKVITEGDPYYCAKCKAILNKFSTVLNSKEYAETKTKVEVELKNN